MKYIEDVTAPYQTLNIDSLFFTGIDNASIFLFLALCLFFSIKLLKSKNNFYLLCLSLSLCFLLFELFFYVYSSSLYNNPKKKHYTNSKSYTQADPLLGYSPIASIDTLESNRIQNDIIYKDVPYSFDQKARKECPPAINEHSHHSLFFGGSYTFGEGIPNAKTLPCYFQEVSNNKYRAYNYGFKGYGTGQMYNQLVQDRLFEDIKQKKGIAVYSFINDHIYRTTGKIRYVIQRKDYPLFRLGSNGTLEGPFKYYDKSSLKYIVGLYRMLTTASPSLHFLINPDRIKFVPDDMAVKTTAKVIIESKKLYDSRFDGDFYVIIWPGRRLKTHLETLFVSILESNGIIVMKIPSMPNKSESIIHPKDGHPSEKAYEWVARHFYRGIKERNP